MASKNLFARCVEATLIGEEPITTICIPDAGISDLCAWNKEDHYGREK